MTYNRVLSIVIGIVVLVFLASYQVTKYIDGLSQNTNALHQKNAADVIQKASLKKKSALVQDNQGAQRTIDRERLKKLGITITPRNTGPSTPDEWDQYVTKNIAREKFFEREEARVAVESSRVTEEEYTEKMDTVKEHIDIVKKRLEEDPFNKKYKQQLQNIYKMRAVGKALRNEVVVQSGVAVPETALSSSEK